jgi:hypothetical protein
MLESRSGGYSRGFIPVLKLTLASGATALGSVKQRQPSPNQTD